MLSDAVRSWSDAFKAARQEDSTMTPYAGETPAEHYIVATQEKALRQTLGGLPGGASIFTNVNGVHMEPASDVQRKAIEQVGHLSSRA